MGNNNETPDKISEFASHLKTAKNVIVVACQRILIYLISGVNHLAYIISLTSMLYLIQQLFLV